MRSVVIGGEVEASVVALGCMHMAEKTVDEADRAVMAALDAGVTFFDHADIYGNGRSEEIFSEVLARHPGLRDRILVQSKCGIHRDGSGRGAYNFSKDYILTSVDGILSRLGTDHLDFLLLHRPDPLMEPDEVAAAFEQLRASGKVLHFGVSNHTPGQMALLGSALGSDTRLLANQMQFSLAHTLMIDQGIATNLAWDNAVDRDGGTIDFCRLNNITVQCWSPLQYGFFDGHFVGSEKYAELNAVLDAIAETHGTTPDAIAVAWILRHPAHMQVMLGSINPERISAVCAASELELTRREWYDLYLAAGNQLP